MQDDKQNTKDDSSNENDGAIRIHSAFLNAFTPEDQGLYDDYPSRCEAEPGATTQNSVPEQCDEMCDWRELAKRNAFSAYVEDESIGDEPMPDAT